MITRKTLEEAVAEGGYIDTAKVDGFTDADIERMIAEDPDLAPPTETLIRLLEVREVRKKLGLSQTAFARRLRIPVATIRNWEQGRTRTDPAIQALLRILDRIPESALSALDETARQAG